VVFFTKPKGISEQKGNSDLDECYIFHVALSSL